MPSLAWRRLTAHVLLDWTDEPVVVAWTLWWINPAHSALRTLVAIAWIAWIAWQLGSQATTGQTAGKRLTGIHVVDATSGQPLGPRRTTLRWLAHGLDTLTVLGRLGAALTNRSIADRLTNSVVTPVKLDLPAR